MLSDQARSFLARQRVAHLATSSADGVPHVVPVCFCLLGETVYVALDEKPKRVLVRALRRVRNIIDNPRVALVADVYDDDWNKLGFVLAQCSARVIDRAPEGVLDALRLKYPQYRGMRLEDRPLIAADIERVTTWGDLLS